MCLQTMGSNQVRAMEEQIEDLRKQGHGTYYGESVEMLANLQMQLRQE